MSQEHILVNDIIADHKERMLNLKKYYPFFRLSEISFGWYKDGIYDCLDMGYILMAVLRFFIEENNFKERDVTYQEYAQFMGECIRRDFSINPPESDMTVLVQYIFDKIKNDGKPFVFQYFDPIDRKKKISRVKLLESKIIDGCVWYSISADGIEFYLDTKEIKDESKISVEQLLLEKMIQAKDFKGGADVISRINQEVDRLWLKKNQVMSLLSADVFSGIEAYEEFFQTGIKWFEDEQKLFLKNQELILGALKKAENEKISGMATDYLMTAGEIYKLDTQLKIAMNNHMKLLAACTELGIMADDTIRKAKLKRLRPGFDFRNALDIMMKQDDISLLELIVKPILGIKPLKYFNISRLEDLIAYPLEKEEKPELIDSETSGDIVFDDEIEDKRIRDNYAALMRLLLSLVKRKGRIELREFNECSMKIFGENLCKNSDYYSFLLSLCQKKEYIIDKNNVKPETFFDEIMKDYYEKPEFEEYKGLKFSLTLAKGNLDRIALPDGFEVTNFIIERT